MLLSWFYILFFFLLSLLLLPSSVFVESGFLGDVLCFGSWWSDFNFGFLINGVNGVCFLMLLICGLLSLHYGLHYFSYNAMGNSLISLMTVFLFVMFSLILSNNFLFSLICWEYLGLTSFFLIIFYTNGVSLRASLITLITSRFGDVALFLIFGAFYSGSEFSCFFMSILCLLVVGTKSAFYPVVGWLIEAMRAPTPVSSLVHSSTLVAAGVWFLLCYGGLFSGDLFLLLGVCSILSIFVSGLCALCEKDLKKVVAFSTCNNISWCILFYLSGDLFLCVVQLLSHGVAKSQVFMLLGDLMSSAESQQSLAGIYKGCSQGHYLFFVRSFLVFCLCGLPFLGVYFSKHNFFSVSFYCYDVLGLVLLLLGLLVSYAYTVRLFLILFCFESGLNWGLLNNFVFVSLMSFLSTLLNWYCVGNVEELSILCFSQSFIILFFELSGVILGWLAFLNAPLGLLLWSSKLWGCGSFIVAIYAVFSEFMRFFYSLIFRWEVWLFSCLNVSGFYSVMRCYGLFFNVSLLSLGCILSLYIWFLLI